MAFCCCGYCGTSLSTVNPTPGICQGVSCQSNDGGAFNLSQALDQVNSYGTMLSSSVSALKNSVAGAATPTTPVSTQAGTIGTSVNPGSSALIIVAVIVVALVFFAR
jgi:hypothetical protein